MHDEWRQHVLFPLSYTHSRNFLRSSLTNLLLNNNNLKDFDADVFAPLVNLTKL